METQPSSAAGDYPSWVMLDRLGGFLDSSTGDARTLARCLSSVGRPVQASFSLVAPPALSTLHLIVGVVGKIYKTHHTVMAAHGDSVLIRLVFLSDRYRHWHPDDGQPPELFVYNAGDGAARPPSLSLLPPYDMNMVHANTGILRLGGDAGGGGQFVVASLNLKTEYYNKTAKDPVVEVRLYMLRSSRCDWELTSVLPVSHANGQEMELDGLFHWQTDAVIPVGDRFLCWIDLCHCQGIIFSDFMPENPELRYVPLPADPLQAADVVSQNVCVTGDGSAVKLVRVLPRCCCGGPGATKCARSQHAFTITTWTLRTDDMTWEENGLIDSDEVWAMAAPVVPRFRLQFPVVSLDDPDVICLASREPRLYHGKGTAWLVTVDTRRKTMPSVCRVDDKIQWNRVLLPSKVSSYFNAACCASSSHKDTVVVPTATTRDKKERKISAAIEEIPGMTRDEMVRAHKVLAGDDRRMRFLVALPVDMRKEYCMIMTQVGATSAVRQLLAMIFLYLRACNRI